MKIKKQFKRILEISDLHAPYSHKNYLSFLKELKKEIKPDLVVFSGDEIDWHAISFHDKDPDLYSPADELDAAIDMLRPLYALFPNAHILESNHGSLVYRRALASGLPSKALKSYNAVLDAPKGWVWSNDLTVNSPQGPIYHHHSRGDSFKTAQTYGMNHVCGHHHESFKIQYLSTPEKLIWGMTVGCLVDKNSLALAYNKTNLKRPIIGCGAVIEGHPRLFPMELKA